MSSFEPKSILKKSGTKAVGKGRIAFSPGTAPPRETRVALTISNYETSSGITTYLVDVWQSGFCWLVRKRYNDFISLHTRVSSELAKYNYSALPELPKKRWFESQRWINKLNPSYVDTRRFALEAYLRLLVRTPLVLERSQALRNFLNLKKLNCDFAAEEFDYQQNKMAFIRFYEIDNVEVVEDNIYHTESEEDENEGDSLDDLERGSSFSAALAASANVDGKDLRISLSKKLENLVTESDLLSPGPGDGGDPDEEDNEGAQRNISTAAILTDDVNEDRNSALDSNSLLLRSELEAAVNSYVPLETVATEERTEATAALVIENPRHADRDDRTKLDLLFSDGAAVVDISARIDELSVDKTFPSELSDNAIVPISTVAGALSRTKADFDPLA